MSHLLSRGTMSSGKLYIMHKMNKDIHSMLFPSKKNPCEILFIQMMRRVFVTILCYFFCPTFSGVSIFQKPLWLKCNTLEDKLGSECVQYIALIFFQSVRAGGFSVVQLQTVNLNSVLKYLWIIHEGKTIRGLRFCSELLDTHQSAGGCWVSPSGPRWFLPPICWSRCNVSIIWHIVDTRP